MSRVHSGWCERHPELDFMSQQNLRDITASLRRRTRRLRRRLSRRSQAAQPGATPEPQGALRPTTSTELIRDLPPTDRDLQQEYVAMLSSRPEHTLLRHNKFKVRAEHLAQLDALVEEQISLDSSLWDIDCAVYAAASLLTPKGPPFSKVQKGKWRIQQLENKMTRSRQEASKIQCAIEALRKGGPFGIKTRRILRLLRSKHHTLNLSTLALLKEKSVNKLRALALARKRLINKVRYIEENSTFLSCPSRLFKSKESSNVSLSVTRTETFWREIYETNSVVQENRILEHFEEYCNGRLTDPEAFRPIAASDVSRAVARARNFAAPGMDGIIAFWWKSFPSVHHHLARIFTSFIEGNEPIPEWLAEGRTVLIPKKGDLTDPKNYRPITCLNTIYKIFTSVLNERTLSSIAPVWSDIYEQRGSKRGLAGCKENLLIDRSVCYDAVTYKRNLSMAWVDYAKAFDTTPHSLIVTLLRILRVHPEVVRCINDLMSLWKTRFAVFSENRTVYTSWIYFRRGVFQGDSLSPLLFCISLLPLSIELRGLSGYSAGPPSRREHKVTHLFYMDDLKLYASNEKNLQKAIDLVAEYTDAIGMSFGLDKCAIMHVHRGKGLDDGNDIHLVDGSIIKHLDAEVSYTFLGVSERGVQDVSHAKQILRSKYLARLRKIWRSCLNGKNKIAATNMLAVPLISYTFGVMKWNVDDLKNLDRKTRKIMNINRSLHPNSSVQRLYLPRDQGGRGLLSMECLHDRVVLSTANYVLRSQDPLLKFVTSHELQGKGAFLFQAARRAAERFGLPGLSPEVANIGEDLEQDEPNRISRSIKKAEQDMLLKDHMSKNIHSVFYKHVENDGLSKSLTFSFLKSAGLKSETEGFVFACQDGVMNTLVYRQLILKTGTSTSCRICKHHPETLMHVLSACPSLCQTSYIYRHNSALRVLYFFLRQAYGIDTSPVLPYAPTDMEAVVENSKCRIYWNYSFFTAKLLSANKPDIVLLDFETKTLYVIELSCPAEKNISLKEDEKRSKYLDLLSELRKLYTGYKVKPVILILGVLGGLKASFKREIEIIPACRSSATSLVCRLQKAVLLGSLRIVRALDLM